MGETSSPANRSSRSLFSPSEVPTNRTPKRQSSESFDSFITSGGTRVTIPAAHPHGGPETSADESSINSSGIGDRVGNNSDNSSSANVGSIMSEEDGVLPKAFLEATAARAYETIGVETIGAATSGNVVHYRTKKIGKPRASKTSKSSSKNKKNADYSAFRKPVGDRTKKMARPRLGSKRRRRIIAVVDGQCGDQNSCGDTENSDSTSDDGNSAAASIVGCTNGMETGEVNEANVNGAATGENDVQNRSMRTETREGCLEESARPSSSPPSVEVVRGNSRGHIRTNEISQDDSNTISRCDFGIIGNDFHNGESGDRDASNITVDYAVPNPASSDTGFTIRAENRKLDGNSRLNENGFAYDKRLVSQADNDDESERKRNDGDDAILDTHQLQSSAVGGIDTKVGEGDNNSRFSEVSETSGNQYHIGGNDTPSAVTAQHCNVATCNLDVLGEEDNLLQSPICEEEGMARGKESSWEIGFASSKIQQSNKDFFMRPVVDDSAPNMLSTSEIVQNQQRLCCQGNVESDNTFDNSGDENGKSESNVTHHSTRRLNDLITSGAEETSLNSVEVAIGSITKKGPCIEAKISCHRTNPDKNNSEDDSLFGSDDDIIEDEKALSGNPSQKDVECKLRFGLAQNIEMTSGSIYGNRPREIVIDSKANETQNRNNHYHALNEFGIFEPPTRELDGKDSDYESSGEGSVYSISAHEQSTKNTGYDIPRKKTANNLSKEFVHVCPDFTDCSITRESKPSTSSCPTKVPELDQLIKRGHQQKMSLIQLPHDSNKARNLLKTNDDESDIRMLARQFKERQDKRENKRSHVAGARPGKKVSFGQNTVYEEPRRRVLGRAARAMTKEVTDISTREKTSNLRSSPPPRAKPAALAPKANAAQNDPNDHGDKKSETQRKYKENQWNKRFDSLRSYITNHNDCSVPEGHSLHKWIIRERNICLRLMRKRNHELSKESPIEIFTKLSHIVKLNSIGFDFGKPTTVRVAEFISSASTVLSPKQRKMLTIEDDSFKSKPVKYPLKQKKRNFKGKFKTCKRSQTRSSSARQSNELSEDEVGVGQTVGESEKNCSKITSQTIEKGTIESDNDQIAGIGGSFTGLQDAEEISTPTSSSKRRKRMSAVATASALISSFSDTNAMDDQVTFSVDNFAGNASEKLQQEHLICPNQKDSADTDEEKQKTNRSGDSNQATFHPLPFCDDHLENERCEDSMDDELNIATGLSKNLLCCTDNGMLSQTASKSPNSTMNEGAKDVSGGADSPAPQEAGPNMDGTDGNSFITPKKRSKTESNNGNDESIESLEKKSRKRAPKASETSTLPPSVKTSFAGGGKSSEKSELITTSTPAELRWQQRLQEWIEFDESAQGKDPQSSTMKQLANWVRTQRTEYRFLQEGRKSAMTSARIELLEKAGFKWKKEPRMTSPAKASKTALLGGNDDKTPPQPSNETTRSFDVAKSNLIETAGLPRASSSAGSSKVVLVSSQQTRKTSKPSEEPSTKSELIENPTSARRKMSGIQDSKSSSLTETIADDDDNICDPASSTSKSHYVGHAQGFNVGDEVYAAWGNVGKKKKALYYPGSVKNSEDVGAGASRRRLYKIAFEDGDVAYNVEESDIILKQEYLEANLKPLLEVGDACYAAWWPTKGRRDQPAWYPGKVRSYKDKVGGRYGPVRLYDIAYDDGDKFNGVEDFYVFSKSEYELSLQKPVDGGKFGWNGVRNKIDKASIDKWANLVGYYVANIDGEEHCFSLLSSALRAYDDYVVRTKKSKTKKTDLNLPEEFRFKAQCKPTRIFALEEFSRAQTKTQGSKKEESFPLPASSMDENNANDDSGRKNKSSLTLKASEIMSRWQQREYKVVHVDSERQQQGEHIDSSEKSDTDEDEEEDDGMSVTQIHTNSRTKPVIKKNEQVYAVWSGGKDCNCWYPGRVWEAHVVTEGSGYGPVKKYDIVFDDGDVEKGVDEVFVMKKVDYEIGIEKDENDWVGVTNYLDRRSKDKYARLVGWYEFTTAAGEHRIYSSLHDALYAYDESIIEERGRPNIIASELNFPNARRKK